jgi:hypothetical protein
MVKFTNKSIRNTSQGKIECSFYSKNVGLQVYKIDF